MARGVVLILPVDRIRSENEPRPPKIRAIVTQSGPPSRSGSTLDPRIANLRVVLSDDTIQQVRDRSNIAQVVGERVKLQRAGRSLKGLCPFHKEKTPSFHVNEERNFYHCFGCQAHGDSIRFVQETEGLSFIEAVRELAGRLGIEITETRSDNERRQDQAVRRQREELISVSEAAARYFERCLEEHPLRHLAWAELQRRGLHAEDEQIRETLKGFRMGYAPYGWDSLAQYLRKSGLSHVAAETVGLLAPRRNGPGHYDRFRHRLMFGVVDLRGKVVAFSGRSLPEPSDADLARAELSSMGSAAEEPAKYINSSESPIYRKRETVFGLFQARDSVRRSDECVLVEGNFDVMSLHARGIDNVVAPLGTAFTREQAALIKRYSQNVTLLFDGDSAGRRATVASREPCEAEGLYARVATLPDGVDPDDLVRQKGPDALRAMLKSAKGMLEHLIESALDSGFSAADPKTQGRKIQEVLELIKAEEDPTVRALAQTHADTIASRLGISDVRTMSALSRAVRQAGAPRAAGEQRLAPSPERARSQARHSAIDAKVLGALTEYPALMQDPAVAELLNHITGPLALCISVLSSHGGSLNEHIERFPAELGQVVARHLAAPQFDDQETARGELINNLTKLKYRHFKQLKAELEQELRQARSAGDVDTELSLLGQLRDLSLARIK